MSFYWLKRYIKRVWDYAIFAVKDEDYDWTYAVQILGWKLGRVRKAIVNGPKRGTHQTKKTARRIKVCENLCRRIANENHSLPEWDKLTESNKSFTGVFGEKVTALTLINREEERTERDLDYLFNCMRRHLQEWWD